jgi:hypothetical protein
MTNVVPDRSAPMMKIGFSLRTIGMVFPPLFPATDDEDERLGSVATDWPAPGHVGQLFENK